MTDTPQQKRPTAADLKEMRKVFKRANAGDPEALERLRAFLDDNPQVWRQTGDLAAIAERAWLTLMAGGDAMARDSIRRQLAHLRASLIGETPTVVEKMLGDCIVGTWMEMHYLNSISADSGGGSKTQSAIFLKHLESAQRRHLAAVKSLTQIRKLLAQCPGPPLQVYSAEKSA